MSLKKTLLSKNSLIPSHTHSPLKKKLFTELKKLSHSHTHSPPTLTVCSLKKTQSLSHSIPSRSQLRSLTLWFGSVVVRLSHSFPLCSSIAVTFSVAVAPPSRSVSASALVSHSHSRSISLPSASPSPSPSPSQQTAGYSHLISSMWFLGFYIIVWFLLIFCFLYVLLFFYFLGVMWIELRLNGFLDFYFYKMFIIININIIYFCVLNWVWPCAQVMLTSK